MAEDQPRLLIMSFSPLRSDARVLRQIRLFMPRYAVTTLGYGEAPDGVVEHLRLPDDIVAWRKDRRLLALRRFSAAYHSAPVIREARELLDGQDRFDVVLANDVDTVPLALDLRPRGGVHADLHEYASRQNEDSWRWRWFVGPYANWLVQQHVTRADSVSTVSEGLAREYSREFGITTSVVANAAAFAQRDPSPVAEPLRLVHSGVARRSRSLTVMIEGVRAATRPVTLDLYLMPNDPAYLQELRDIAEDLPQVRFRDPVPPTELSATLADYDVGVFLLPPVNFNYEHALPNKFFDYVQARLAILVGPSPEMAALVRRHHLGMVCADHDAASLAAALNSLDAATVQAGKQGSHRAARELSAENQLVAWGRVVDVLGARARRAGGN